MLLGLERKREGGEEGGRGVKGGQCRNPHLSSLSLQVPLNSVSSPHPSYPSCLDLGWSQTGSSPDPASSYFLSSSRKLSLWSPAWGLKASKLSLGVLPVQEVGNPICTQIDNPHAHGSSVVDGKVSRIWIHLEARLHSEPRSVTTHFLKLRPALASTATSIWRYLCFFDTGPSCWKQRRC